MRSRSTKYFGSGQNLRTKTLQHLHNWETSARARVWKKERGITSRRQSWPPQRQWRMFLHMSSSKLTLLISNDLERLFHFRLTRFYFYFLSFILLFDSPVSWSSFVFHLFRFVSFVFSMICFVIVLVEFVFA
jgi:hypothetical protein